MMRKVRGTLQCGFALLVVFSAALSFADPTGRIRGKVKDLSGNPLDQVTIHISATGEVHQEYTAHTNSKGEYGHIGISTGRYRVTAAKEGYTPAANYGYVDLSVTANDEAAVADFVMQPVTVQKKSDAASSAQPGSDDVSAAKAGVALLKEGKIDEAIASLQKALQIDANQPVAHYNLGVAYDRKDRPEDAQKEFQEAIKLKSDFAEAYLALADSYMSARKYGEATDVLVKATQLDPQSYSGFYNLGVCYSNSGKYAEAEAAYRKAAVISPKEPIVHYQLGMSLLGQSKNSEAKAEFQKYLELNPNAADKQEVQELLQSLQ